MARAHRPQSLSGKSPAKTPPLPKLPFGARLASLENDARRFTDKMALVVPGLNAYEPIGNPAHFQSRTHAVVVNGLRMVASANTAVTIDVGKTSLANVMIPFYGSNVSRFGSTGIPWQVGANGIFIPAIGRAGHCETRATLTIDVAPERLRQCARGMLGLDPSAELHLDLDATRPLPLTAGGTSFDTAFRHLCALIDSQLERPEALALLGVDDLIYRCLAQMFLPEAMQDNGPKAAAPRSRRTLDPLCEYLVAHIDAPLSLTAMEAHSGLSRRALQYAFLSRFGCTPMAWLRSQRLHRARQRLLQGSPGLAITDIALASGFANSGAFATCYRKEFGETPSETLRSGR
jgi:AraC-like DNA-binding protein